MSFFGCFLLVFQKSSSFCRENEIFENKRKHKKKLSLTYKKANLGPVFNFTASIYIYPDEIQGVLFLHFMVCQGAPFFQNSAS